NTDTGYCNDSLARHTSTCTPTGSILKFIHDFTETMDHWRKVNNADVEMAHQTWTQKVVGFMTSSNLARDYYGFMIEDLKEGHYVELEKNQESSLPRRYNNFVKRSYPFFRIHNLVKNNLVQITHIDNITD